MDRHAARNASSILACLVALGLAAAGPARALDEPYLGSKACMSDQQLEKFMTYLLLSFVPRYLDACRQMDPRLREDVQKAFIAFETSSYPLVEKLSAEVTEILRPAYGEDAAAVRVALRKEAEEAEHNRAFEDFGAGECKRIVQNIQSIAGEITIDGAGKWAEPIVAIGVEGARKLIRRC